MRYYIIAGERSGDLHGGNLVHELKKADPNAEFRGFGGDHMKSEGVSVTVHYVALAYMGFIEVVFNINKIRKFMSICKNDILEFKPDVVILIDYGGFNTQIARFAKQKGFRVDFYIPPKYWAWGQRRAGWLKPYVDNLYVILPFEKKFFMKFDWVAHYVGNPVLDAVKAHQEDTNFRDKNHLTRPYIAFLPGSRKQELERILPLMTAVSRNFPDYQFAVAAVSNLPASLYQKIGELPNVRLVFEDTYNLLTHAIAAVVTSGTATLETALFKVPQIVVYKANRVSYLVGKKLIRVEFISLVNLIAGREVVSEMIQDNATPQNISRELDRILHDVAYKTQMVDGYSHIIDILDTGSASQNTARLIRKYTKG